MDMLTKGMTLVLKRKPRMRNKVTDIRAGKKGTLKVIVNHTMENDYAHVISTVPLGPLQAINMTELKLGYFRNNAIRTLKYVYLLTIQSEKYQRAKHPAQLRPKR